MTEHTALTRRTFVGGAAAGALATLGLSRVEQRHALAEEGTAPSWLGEPPAITDADCVETLDFEVVVVGAGTAGYFAAASAAESGARTLLIEKAGVGFGVRSSALGAVGSRQQKELGIEIDPVEIANDFSHYAQGRADMRLIRLWTDNSAEAIDWYEDLMAPEGIGVQLEWNMPQGTRYVEWPTGHGTNGRDGAGYEIREGQVSEVLNAYIEGFEGCEIRFETPMRCLIQEEGRVVGLYAEGPDGMIRVNASKGVVVATGGYAYNKEMYQDLHAEDYASHGTFDAWPFCTGDGIKALLWLGASMDDVPSSVRFNRCLLRADQNEGTPYDTLGDYGYFFFSSQPFLRVDDSGARFHNESEPYECAMGASANRPAGHRHWHQIWDGNWKEDIQRFHTVGCSTITFREGADHDAWPTMIDDWIAPEMEDFVQAGYIVKADTLEELAEGLGLTDVEGFLATCERQNENFDAQMDADFGKEAFRLSELRTPPFYGTVKSCGFTLCTTDGIRVNPDLQPLGADGQPIEGVYVAGNDQGSYYGGIYPNLAAGANAGRCATFGRLLGKRLAAL